MQNSLNIFFLYVIFVDFFFLSLNYRHEINQRGRGLRRREGGARWAENSSRVAA